MTNFELAGKIIDLVEGHATDKSPTGLIWKIEALLAQRAEAKPTIRIQYVAPTQAQIDEAWKGVAKIGDCKLVWINEGDLCPWPPASAAYKVEEIKP